MTAFTVPARLAAGTARDRSPARRRWLARLAEIVDDLQHQWGLTLRRPFHPRGQASWVGPASYRHGHDVVLKSRLAAPEAMDDAAGLRAWNRRRRGPGPLLAVRCFVESVGAARDGC